VEKETATPVDSSGKKFRTGKGRIIPTSYGTGYGLELRTKEGAIIDQDSFPCIVDWELGDITFNTAPFDVGFDRPPLVSYHFYSGKTLENVNTYTVPGMRGAIGPAGETGPVDQSILTYRGQTDFTVSPAVQYMPNDVVTFTTNGNSYICLAPTEDSPLVSPASWENISPAGTSAQMPENVLYVNHPNAIPTSGVVNGSNYYYTSLQDAIDASEPGVATTIIVNQLNNQYPVAAEDITIQDRVLNIVFKKWANVSSDAMLSSGFRMSVVDSDVTIQDAQIGGGMLFVPYSGFNEVLVSSVASDAVLRFIGCKISSKLILNKRNADFSSKIEFERCSINSEKIVTNSDVIIRDCTFSGTLSADYTQEEVQGKEHILHIFNSFGFQRATKGSRRNLGTYDVVVAANRDDTNNLSIKIENSIAPGFGVRLFPETYLYSPVVVRIDSNNSAFYHMGIDETSSKQGATINVVGSNVMYGVYFNSFDAQFSLINDPYNSLNAKFFFSIDGPGGAQIPVVTWDPGSVQRTSYDAYKALIVDDLEGLMLSL
jgi:hypothetical protein